MTTTHLMILILISERKLHTSLTPTYLNWRSMSSTNHVVCINKFMNGFILSCGHWHLGVLRLRCLICIFPKNWEKYFFKQTKSNYIFWFSQKIEKNFILKPTKIELYILIFPKNWKKYILKLKKNRKKSNYIFWFSQKIEKNLF